MADTVESMGENTTMRHNKTLLAKRNMLFTDLVNSAESMDHATGVMVVTDTVDLCVDMEDTVMVGDTDQCMADTVESMEEATMMRKNKTLPEEGKSLVFSNMANFSKSMDYATGDMVAMDTVNLDVDMAGTGMEEDTD